MRTHRLMAWLLVLAIVVPAGAAGVGEHMCEDGCWKNLKANLKDCREEFPDLADPLRESCGDAATIGYKRCLDRCASPAGMLFAKHLTFAPSGTDTPLTQAFLLRNDRAPGRYFITVLNGDGTGGGVDRLEILLDRRPVWERTDFHSVVAAEVPIDLESGAYALAVRSDGFVSGAVTVFVSDRPLADRGDLEG
jgi:hypothetical protein